MVVRAASARATAALVAYVVARPAPDRSASCAEFLRGRLPAAMVPSAFVRSGRAAADRQRQGRPAGAAGAARWPDGCERRPRAPRTPVEEMLAGICARGPGASARSAARRRLLRSRRPLAAGDAGGVAGAARRCGVELPLRALFEAPDGGGAGRAGRGGARRGRLAAAADRASRPRAATLPLSFAQERLWFLDQLEPGSAAYNLPARCASRAGWSPRRWRGRCREIVRRHEVLRTRFAAHGGEPAQVVDPPLPCRCQRWICRALPEGAREHEARRLAREEAQAPFDLAAVPLLRATLLRLGDESWICLLTQHHIASDGGSIAVLIEEMSALYEVFLVGRPSPLAEPLVQYGDYAVWQRQARGEALAEEAGLVAGAPAARPRCWRCRTTTRAQRRRAPSAAGAAGASGAVAGVRVARGDHARHAAAGFGLLLSRYAGQSRCRGHRWRGVRAASWRG